MLTPCSYGFVVQSTLGGGGGGRDCHIDRPPRPPWGGTVTTKGVRFQGGEVTIFIGSSMYMVSLGIAACISVLFTWKYMQSVGKLDG